MSMDSIPKVNKSLCGCSLGRGTKIIAIYHACSQFLMVVLFSLGFSLIRSRYRESSDEPYEAVLAILGVLCVVSAWLMVTSFLLILAVFLHRKKLAKPWLVTDMISRVVDFFLFIWALTLPDKVFAFIAPIRIGVGIYLWLIVYSHYCNDFRNVSFGPSNTGDSASENERLINT